uniref:Uncharacterized protein n=2 Tax=Anaerobacillus isosaccharinicus TaxID=1532552 RepID=A0A1S2M4E1_9BACI|nr:hypothetical protein [Anaerobacillus isosaccharinicus]QOY35352.1 hypothetical protein AWH56_022100 [Anaerobacillus isosaccharinicus]
MMEEKIFEILVKMQSNIEEMNERLKRVEGTVNRIEASQTEDVVGMLKVTKKKTDFEVDYLNNKLTEMDKRLFSLEKRIEN